MNAATRCANVSQGTVWPEWSDRPPDGGAAAGYEEQPPGGGGPDSIERLGDGAAEAAQVGTRDVYFTRAEGFVPTPIYDRDRLTPGAQFAGPAEDTYCS